MCKEMADRNTAKLYAAYKSGFLGEDRLNTYFSFLASIIVDNRITEIETATILRLFRERYSFDLPLGFVRQVLSVGVKNGSIVFNRGKYSVVQELLSKYSFEDSSFESHWTKMLSEFKEHCNKKNIVIDESTLENDIMKLIDQTDDAILASDYVEMSNSPDPISFGWYSYVAECSEFNESMFRFISALCTSNITKQALFYSGSASKPYPGLALYLDSPMIFSLLGIGDTDRTEAYTKLVKKAQELGCDIHILDHNLSEVKGILSRSSVWALSVDYDIRKANDATRYFHDNGMSREEIEEFCSNVESKLNSLGITQKIVDYDAFEHQFQEDEDTLYEMVKRKYSEQGLMWVESKEYSIRIDVRSIIMLYRLRGGQVSTDIENSKHLMLTSNNAIANVSKNFESNKSINSGHIPACISADLFAALLWFSSPVDMMDYRGHKLLADCYRYLQPSPALVEKYIKSLETARESNDIDEKKFLFLRTHSIVLNALMNVTHGDYARYDDKTYLEVYDYIVETSRKEYHDEVAAHQATKDQLEKEKETSKISQEKKDSEISQLTKKVQELETAALKERERKARRRGWVYTLLLCGIPYVVFLTAGELIKAQFADFAWLSWISVGAIVLASIAAPIIYAKGKTLCFSKARKHYGLIQTDASLNS